MSQRNYQPNYGPITRFPALPQPINVVPSQPTGQQGNNGGNTRMARPQQERAKFDLIPMIYTELYPELIQDGLLVPISIPPIQPPYPIWYNENASHDYHSLEDCTALKWRVSELIKKS